MRSFTAAVVRARVLLANSAFAGPILSLCLKPGTTR